MSDTQDTPVDNATQSVAGSPAVAPPSGGGAPESTPASADTAVPGEPSKEQPQAEPKRDRKVEKRISKLTQRAEEAIREAGYWRGLAEANQRDPATGEPAPRQAMSPEQAAVARAESEASKSVLDRLTEAGADIEDFDEVIEKITASDFKISRTMRDYFGEADHPAQLAQWLSENPNEAARISRLDPAVAVRALEKADARMGTKPAPKTTKAPPPVPTVGGRSAAAFDPDKAPMEDYAANWKQRNGVK